MYLLELARIVERDRRRDIDARRTSQAFGRFLVPSDDVARPAHEPVADVRRVEDLEVGSHRQQPVRNLVRPFEP